MEVEQPPSFSSSPFMRERIDGVVEQRRAEFREPLPFPFFPTGGTRCPTLSVPISGRKTLRPLRLGVFALNKSVFIGVPPWLGNPHPRPPADAERESVVIILPS